SPAALQALGEAADPGMTVRFLPVGVRLLTGVLYERPSDVHADPDGKPNRAELQTALANGMALVPLTLV
ncbi:MAG: hypothetical protein KDB44_16500, partial [Mycobacterium sp.]|nr:hypothetical protein [Mycobacterium sp.]